MLKASLFTVIDGHGGDWCAQFLQSEVIPFFAKTLRQQIEAVGEEEIYNVPISSILKESLFKMHHLLDREYFNRSQEAAMHCGAACSVVFMIGDMLYCDNLGDCRTVLSRNGKAVNLSADHKSSRKSELRRVT